ncbi:hypothetical protein [Rhodococcus sp. IEGM 1379]|uniref:hypothetical protein n=1 Tax=Rhodococcus sp. IEGM 1379 TaxID=3047086 RepID=UPI0024B7C22A|nr:hypothetical protein [Rhodococcus sp. IEGM 1379]MDI9917855.1 hypothetical protein [Rhodococcus sp. IEGM 1379]
MTTLNDSSFPRSLEQVADLADYNRRTDEMCELANVAHANIPAPKWCIGDLPEFDMRHDDDSVERFFSREFIPAASGIVGSVKIQQFHVSRAGQLIVRDSEIVIAAPREYSLAHALGIAEAIVSAVEALELAE